MHRLFILMLISFAVSASTARSQSVTEKDFRILIDGKQYTDSVNSISIADLLKMQKVTANFSWITVKSIVIYYHPSFDVLIKRCFTNVVCDDAKEIMKRLKPGNVITISIDEAFNRQGLKVNIKEITFLIK